MANETIKLTCAIYDESRGVVTSVGAGGSIKATAVGTTGWISHALNAWYGWDGNQTTIETTPDTDYAFYGFNWNEDWYADTYPDTTPAQGHVKTGKDADITALFVYRPAPTYNITGSVAIYNPSTGSITPGSGGKIRITASGLDTGQVTSVNRSWNNTYTTATAYPSAGYSFYGWGAFGDFNTSSTSSSNPAYGYVRDDGTATFYALFIATTYRTVYYYKNDGTSEQDYDTYVDGSTATVRHNTWTRSGYIFKGWATSSTGSVSTYYYEGRTFTINSNVSLYAVWEAVTPPTTDYYMRIFNNGSWHKAIPYIYNNGWKKTIPYLYSNGSWHKGG